tara:strand:- start:131 stop:529 length:399 start_codon:yes stop_codon:yes gene_type:complete
MKKILFTLILFFQFGHVNAATTSCDSEDTACVAQLLSDASDANDTAILKMLVVGGGAYYLWNNRSKDEKEELMQSLKDGHGLPLIDSDKFALSLFPAKAGYVSSVNSDFVKPKLYTDKSFDMNIIKFSYKFN